jgi:hypothetical protein
LLIQIVNKKENICSGENCGAYALPYFLLVKFGTDLETGHDFSLAFGGGLKEAILSACSNRPGIWAKQLDTA